ncbi:MAG: hypothetical protein K0R38_6645 [Polyangiaceae bacterium]|jgi:hypothetical protein|nr:hypothetical protein [Polyangiaceae bacterium]
MTKRLGPRATKAIDIVVELAKQLITLSTGVIAITISLAKDIFAGQTAGLGYLIASWIAYLFCITFGVWVLMAIAGVLDPLPKAPAKVAKREVQEGNDGKEREEPSGAPPPRKKMAYLGFNVRFPSALQIIAFLVATTLTAVAGWKQLSSIGKPVKAVASPAPSASPSAR